MTEPGPLFCGGSRVGCIRMFSPIIRTHPRNPWLRLRFRKLPCQFPLNPVNLLCLGPHFSFQRFSFQILSSQLSISAFAKS